MKKTAILTAMALLALLTSCGSGSNSEANKEEAIKDVPVETVKEESFPVGYPQEIALPEGFKPSQIRTGEGSRTNAEGTITYKTYLFDKMMPENRAELISHYQKIVEEQQWEGDWRISDEGQTGSGTFVKDNMELEIKVTDMLFTFNLHIF
jgi:hypothetical protein